MYQNVLFDLDGTLTDPGLGITNSVMFALRRFHIEVKDRAELYRFIGPPLTESFEKFYGMTPEESRTALSYYREYFRPYGMFENQVYDGIPAMLATLRESGRRLIVATSKPEEFAVKILAYFDLAKYFDFIGGSTMDGSLIKKADVIRYALAHCEIDDLAGTVMIGDREHDVLGAREVGLDAIGVLYGYGDRAELQNAGATYIAERVEDIVRFL